MRLVEIVAILEKWFPPRLAEDWDNVGLLLGDPTADVAAVMTCLTVTPESADEAIAKGANLIVAHHPILFRGVKRLTADGPEGMVYRLARAGVAVYSPHTAFDGATQGINEQIATALGLVDVQPIRAAPAGPSGDELDSAPAAVIGAGRWGRLLTAVPLADLARSVQAKLAARRVEFAGEPDRLCQRVAIACGAAAEFLPDAAALECDAFVTGEARFHDCLAARQLGVGLILAGHYATERFAVESLALRLSHELPLPRVWGSEEERDPLSDVARTDFSTDI